jgi:hypothetical protein
MNDWESNYKSMPVRRLLSLELPKWLTGPERQERMAFIADEIRIRGWREGLAQ